MVLRKPVGDMRGSFQRIFCEQELFEGRLNLPIKQVNLSYTKGLGTIRGFHFQYPPFSETKIISCIKGRVFDVAVDLRTNSETFLNWFGIELSAENYKSLIIPEGFAHGFLTLEPDTDILYQIDRAFTPGNGRAVRWNDPAFAIDWPAAPDMISPADANLPDFVER